MIRRAARLAAALALTALPACAQRQPASTVATPTPHVAAAVPAPRWSASDVAALDARLRGVLGAPGLARAGIAVVDARGQLLFGRRERTAMTPASTFKLLVGAAALTTLGPQFRFRTSFEAFAAPDGERIDGDLYLVGSGDPTLTRDDLAGGAAAVARTGVRTVDGRLLADAGAFGGDEVNPAWDPDDLQYGYAAGTSALSLDEGTVEFHLVPGAPGVPAEIRVLPPSPGVHVRGGVITGATTLLSITRAPDRNDFVFDGRIAQGAEQSFWRPVTVLPRYAADVARAMLLQRGVHVVGGIGVGVAPLAPAVLWRHESAPLAAIVREMFVTSNNHFAEQLLRALGATRGIGTEANGARVERAVLAADGVPQGGLRIVDGSGLAASDRIAALTLALLLARTEERPQGSVFLRALPRVGVEGTVRWRRLTTAAGRARAKSGHIDGVNALAGYVQTSRHGRVSFAVLVNDPQADADDVDNGIDALLDRLAAS